MHQSSGFAQPDVNAAVLSHAAFTDPGWPPTSAETTAGSQGLCIGAYRISIAAFQADRPPWVRGTALIRQQ
jgi:hypothetical protein